MQRSSTKRVVAVAFAAAFLAGGVCIFRLIAAAAELLAISELPWRMRVGIAAACLFGLAAADLLAIAKASYCPISLRRQTPRALMRRYDLRVVALVWGFDTGLLVTTFRVAAVSWGALVLAALGLAHGWTGLGYGLGFAVPFLLLLYRPQLGRASGDPGLESMLKKRPVLQAVSATLLCASGLLLVGVLNS